MKIIAAALLLIGIAPVWLLGEDIDLLLDAGRIAQAAERAEKTAGDAERHYWLAKVAFYRAEYGRAAEEMRLALAGEKDGWRELARFYEAVDSVTRGFREFRSEHFLLRAGGDDVILADQALEALERSYAEIGGDLGFFPGEKILVEVFPGKDEFALVSTLGMKTLEKSGTVGICKFNRLMLLSPQALPLGYAWCDTLAHEYTHLLVAHISRGKCPLWLHEGIARYHDTRWRLREPRYLNPSGRNELLAARKAKQFVAFKRMHPSLVYLKDQREIELAFAEVSSCVDFMKREYGPGVLGKLLKEIADSGEEKAFRRVLGTSREKLERKWQSHVGALALEETPGALSDRPDFAKRAEEDFIGQDLRGQIRLGDEMRRIGRPDGALAQYRKALALEPGNPVVLLKMARAHLALGAIAEAEKELLAAIDRNPNYVTPYQALGELYCGNGRYREAAETLAGAVRINPFHPDTHRLLARAYLALDRREEAVREMQVVRRIDPSDAATGLLLERMLAPGE